MTDTPIALDYFFDPFCGWCYASAPALAALAEAYPDALAMRPSGLFGGDGARPVSFIADHAWRNDTRITELTGQVFTTEYRDRILLDPEGFFDSTYATRAIVAFGEVNAKLEPALLHALQTARYLGAQDTSKPEIVAKVATELARAHGHELDETEFTERLARDEGLAARAQERIRETMMLMQRLGGAGVPQLLVRVGDHGEVVQGADLYGGAATVTKAVERIAARAKTRSA